MHAHGNLFHIMVSLSRIKLDEEYQSLRHTYTHMVDCETIAIGLNVGTSICSDMQM